MYEPVLIISNGHHRRLAVAAVPVHCITGEAGFAHSMQLSLQGLRHVCCVAEGQLVASEQQGVDHSQQSLLGLRYESGACCGHQLAGQTGCHGDLILWKGECWCLLPKAQTAS